MIFKINVLTTTYSGVKNIIYKIKNIRILKYYNDFLN